VTPADAIRQVMEYSRCIGGETPVALREALQIVENVTRVREALDAGAQNLSGVSRAALEVVRLERGERPKPFDFQSSHGAAWDAGYSRGHGDGYADANGWCRQHVMNPWTNRPPPTGSASSADVPLPSTST
jgi:hypothetical protein